MTDPNEQTPDDLVAAALATLAAQVLAATQQQAALLTGTPLSEADNVAAELATEVLARQHGTLFEPWAKALAAIGKRHVVGHVDPYQEHATPAHEAAAAEVRELGQAIAGALRRGAARHRVEFCENPPSDASMAWLFEHHEALTWSLLTVVRRTQHQHGVDPLADLSAMN